MTDLRQKILGNLSFDDIYSKFSDSFSGNVRTSGIEISIRCPFHDDRTPSMSVNTVKKVFKCHGCDKSGSFIDLLGYLINPDADMKERFKSALEYTGLSDEPYDKEMHKINRKIARLLPKKITPPIENIYTEADEKRFKAYEALFSDLTLTQQGEDYLTKQRGLSIDTIRKYNIVSIDSLKDFLHTDFRYYEYEALGLIYEKNDYYYIPLESDSIMFPHYIDGRIRYYSNRIIKPVDGKKNINIAGVKTEFFAGDRDMKQFDTVYLFEGVLNALSFYELTEKTNFYACLGKPSPKSVDLLLQKYKKVCLALDNDEAGLNATKNILNCYLINPNSYSNIKHENICTFNYQKYYQKYNIPPDSKCDMNDILKISKGIISD